jgi:hypothetical protein
MSHTRRKSRRLRRKSGGEREKADINLPIMLVRSKDKNNYIQMEAAAIKKYYSANPRIPAKEVPGNNVKPREKKDINNPINLAFVSRDKQGKIYIQSGDKIKGGRKTTRKLKKKRTRRYRRSRKL